MPTPLRPGDEALRARLESDAFARFMGMELLEAAPGTARMAMKVRPEHGAMQGVTHGGAIFALAEAALAAATHAYNIVTLALSVTIHFHAAPAIGDTLVAEVHEQRAGARTGSYTVEVRDQANHLVASCQAMVYRTRTPLVAEDPPA